MNQVRSERYGYEALGGQAWCQLEIYQGDEGAVVAVATELPDNPGPSITAWADQLAYAVWRQEGAPPVFTWIEHYPAEASPDLGESFASVQFEQAPDGRFTTPRWHAVAHPELAALLAQPDVPDAAWRSLPLRRLQMDCANCGQPLTISAILAGTRICDRCAAGEAPSSEAGSDAKAARAAWQQRSNMHIRQLALTRAQRAGLLAALLGTRSLWALTPSELDALAARIEAFPSAAAVQAFLDGSSRQDGPSRTDD